MIKMTQQYIVSWCPPKGRGLSWCDFWKSYFK